MLKTVNASFIDGIAAGFYYADTPDECCICHTSIHPKLITAVYSGTHNKEGSLLQIIYQCTKDSCQQIFIANYQYTFDESNIQSHHLYKFMNSAPKSPVKITFSDSITAVSPNFVEIYNQAIVAEAIGLDQITGIGLRKALEFLIKDFAISQRPADTTAIQAAQLGQCINNYIDEPNVKVCAARATWLGNDETHYIRKWLDKDINDLKTLIKLTINWIDNVLLTEKYLNSMT